MFYDVYLCMQQVCDTVYICVHVHVQCVCIYAPGTSVCKCVSVSTAFPLGSLFAAERVSKWDYS